MQKKKITKENYRQYQALIKNYFGIYCEQKQYVEPILAGKKTVIQMELTQSLFQLMLEATKIYEAIQAAITEYEEAHDLKPTARD